MENSRFKFRVWDKILKEYNEYHDYILFEDGTLGEYDSCSPVQEWYEIEQCTGLKDKNGNLIYEGDVLLCDRKTVDGATGAEVHYKTSGVVQRDKNGQYFIEGKNWYGSDITFYNECAEIIGNIHEQAEQGETK